MRIDIVLHRIVLHRIVLPRIASHRIASHHHHRRRRRRRHRRHRHRHHRRHHPRSKFSDIVRDSFCGNKEFQRAHKEGFTDFVNRDSKTAMFLSLFVDDVLKNAARQLKDDEADKMLTDVILLFRYLTDKDVFENYYKEHLAKRLL